VLSDLVAAILDRFGQDAAVASGGRPQPESVRAVHIGHRWLGRAVLVLFRHRDRSPWLVVKIDRYPPYAERLHREHAALTHLAREDAVRGLVPAPVGILERPTGTALVQSGVAGSPLTAVLRRRGRHWPRAARRDHDAVYRWFEWLHESSTARSGDSPVTIDLGGLGDDLMAILPAELTRTTFVRDLLSRAVSLGAFPVPTGGVHGDPGPSNLLRHRRRRPLRVIDWEGYTAPHHQLVDAVLFLNHYARATPGADGKLPTRRDAIHRAFLADDDLGRLSRATWHRLLADRGVPEDTADLLVIRTALDLATGRAPSAHGERGRAMWTDLLTHLVGAATSSPTAWRTAWPPRT